ncbi:hypothetical protein INT48_001086, partial [Thamnidium elegans]
MATIRGMKIQTPTLTAPTRKGKERETPLPSYDSIIADMDMTMDNPTIIFPSQPIIKPAKPRRKRVIPKLNYDIVSTVLDQNSNIPVDELLEISPIVKRQFVNALKTPRQPKVSTFAPEFSSTPATMQDLLFVDDDDDDTTVIYTDFIINALCFLKSCSQSNFSKAALKKHTYNMHTSELNVKENMSLNGFSIDFVFCKRKNIASSRDTIKVELNDFTFEEVENAFRPRFVDAGIHVNASVDVIGSMRSETKDPDAERFTKDEKYNSLPVCGIMYDSVYARLIHNEEIKTL